MLRDVELNPTSYHRAWRVFATAEAAESWRMREDSACISVVPLVVEFNELLGF